MLFTSTLQRKALLGLSLVLLMAAALSLSGISGLWSLGDVVDDLDFSINKAPRRDRLVSSVANLIEPLLLDLPDSQEAASYQQEQFRVQLASVRESLAEFREQTVRMPPSTGALARKPITDALLADMERRLAFLNEAEQSLGNADARRFAAQRLLNHVAELQTIARRIPDPQLGLNQTLVEARDVYRSRILWVAIASVLTVVIFTGLIIFGYRSIFSPMKELCEGASRVAQGRFDYKLCLQTNDEMADLARAFNDMTARFLEIKQDLDLQVRERSKQLVRSERLAGVGFLSAGVAHEINNPLSAIVMATDSIQSRLAEILAESESEDGQVVSDYLEMIQREAMRCREITAKLLDFSRAQDTTREPTYLNETVAEVVALVGHMGRFRDRTIDYDSSVLCNAEVNGSEIKQVILNLVANALESMEAGGTLKVKTEQQIDQVVLTFEDDGCGMSAEVIDNLFEPFFTQKTTGKGTGLGLSISNRIITDHGGRIDVHSDGAGCGSRFRVSLPRKAAELKAA